MKAITCISIPVVSLFLLASVFAKMPEEPVIRKIIKSVRLQYAPDPRTSVFDVFYRISNKGIFIEGEVDDPDSRAELVRQLRKILKRPVFNNIRLLPENVPGTHTEGLVAVALMDLRRSPGRRTELVSQALMGTAVKILKRRKGFLYIQLPDRYLGWTDSSDISILEEGDIKRWNSADRIIVTAFRDSIRLQPDSISNPVCEVLIGCVMETDGSEKGWRSVILPGGKKGFIRESSVEDLGTWKDGRQLTGDNIEKTAVSFLGIPYKWGGTSVKGMDCSGFTKTVYKLNGGKLERDADQQSRQGYHVLPGKNFEKLRKGDLLFFGKKGSGRKPEHITHVGIFLGDGLFIHSPKSKHVQYGSFKKSSKYYDRHLSDIFVRARRLF